MAVSVASEGNGIVRCIVTEVETHESDVHLSELPEAEIRKLAKRYFPRQPIILSERIPASELESKLRSASGVRRNQIKTLLAL